MLSHHERQEVINILNDVLGVGTSMKNDEQAHHCPFCHHHKKKLQVNLKHNIGIVGFVMQKEERYRGY